MGGIWGVASRDLSEVALIYVLVEGPRRRPRLGQPCSRCWRVRRAGAVTVCRCAPATADQGGRGKAPEVLPGPAPGAACLIFSLRVGQGPEEGRFGDYFMP